MVKVGFVGHRKVLGKNVYEILQAEIERQIKHGCKNFVMGNHGEFDRWALAACRLLRNRYADIEIEVVLTRPIVSKNADDPLADVDRVMFDIEHLHYKRQITESNRKMIDGCSLLICYVNPDARGGGARAAMRYAERRGVATINLYRKEDQPLYGMSKQEIDKIWDKL